MPTEIAVRFRVDPQTRRRLDRLRTEKAINVSAWLRLLVQQGLDHEFPDDVAEQPDPEPVEPPATPPPKPDPGKPPIHGWKPRRLPGGEWGAVLTGPDVAELPDDDQLPRTPIVVTDNKGDTWTTTLVDLVSRTESTVLVRTSGRPRD